MSVPIIAYPFRLAPSGVIQTVEEGTDEQYAQELAVAVLTRPGERDLVPDFGIADPAFVGFDHEALQLHISMFGPPVELTAVTVTPTSDTAQDVTIDFESSGQSGEYVDTYEVDDE